MKKKKKKNKLKRGRFRFKKLLSTFRAGIGKLWAPLTLITISLILSFLNYQPNTWLTGWDNLHPEFNFPLNIRRSIFAVWQEYQGLGLLGGMAHAADLPRQLILYAINLLGVPSHFIRYLWTFIMLTLGPLGVYFFIKNLILKHKFDSPTKTFAALLGGLFYLLNLSTVQIFFVPFETFTSFFGFFPWLLLVTINYLKHPTKRHYLHLILTYLLATPAFYVETLFVVLILCLLPIFVVVRNHYKIIFTTTFTILVTQAYWLLPVMFFVLTNGHVAEQAKINLIATPETYLRNLEFANLKNLSLLKGFLFNFLDLGPGQKFTYLMLPWRQHLQNPLVNLIGYLNFILVLTGIYYAFKKKLKLTPKILSITIICLFFLLGGGLLINTKIPLVGELFRSPFTKFSTPLAFTYAVFFSIGCIFILDLFSFLHHKLTYIFTLFTLSLSLLIFISPAFSGQLISPSMRQSIPQDYFEVFNFFKHQDPNTRIANFPQHTFWGWNFYSWSYRGSGFLWYGIKQPILDRAFDVWEKQNENYYKEISAAIYSQNQKDFEKIIEKYAINWILIDNFVSPPEENQDLKTKDLISMLNTSKNFKLEKNVNNNILIYKSNIDKRINNFLSIRPDADVVSSCRSSDSEPCPSLPSYTETENLVPVEISYKKLPGQILIELSPLLPSTPNYIYLDTPLFQSSFILEIYNQYFELVLPGELLSQPEFYPLTTVYLPTKDQLNINIYTNSPTQTINVTSALKDATPYQCYTNKKDRDIEKITYQNSISLLGTDVVGCLSLPLPSFTPPGLISTQYTHFSPTQTPANTNITTHNLSFSTTPPQPLHSKITPTTVRQFSPITQEKQQLNLILEANNSNLVQEITYQDITTNLHSLLASASLTLNPIPKSSTSEVEDFILPTITTSLNILQTPKQNQLLPQVRNCNQFRSGDYSKTTTPEAITYHAKNATACDSLDLRHLPHSINYLIKIDHQNIEGLPLTICLENHSTHRCDVFERLPKGPSTFIQPISNPAEPPGYTLHLYNQSLGNRPTTNKINSISISPYPLNFLKGFDPTIKDRSPASDTVIDGSSPGVKSGIIGSTHPFEFLYTASIKDLSPASGALPSVDSPGVGSVLSLHQTHSPYWLAITKDFSPASGALLSVDSPGVESNITAWPTMNRAESSGSWHNSWQLPPGDHDLIIIYLPQLLEFLGFFLLITLPIFYIFSHHQKRS